MHKSSVRFGSAKKIGGSVRFGFGKKFLVQSFPSMKTATRLDIGKGAGERARKAEGPL